MNPTSLKTLNTVINDMLDKGTVDINCLTDIILDLNEKSTVIDSLVQAILNSDGSIPALLSCCFSAGKSPKKSIREIKEPKDQSVPTALKIIGKGIQNSGNSCYMAAVLQGLLRVPQISKKIWGNDEPSETSLPVCKFLKKTTSASFGMKGPQRTLKTSETENIRSFFRNQGWKPKNPNNQMEDAAVFLEFLLSQLQVPQFAATTRIGKGSNNKEHLLTVFLGDRAPNSLQEIVATKTDPSTENTRKPYHLFPDNIPEILPIVIEGRTVEGKSKNRTKILPSKQLEMPLQNKPKEYAKYDLTAVILYEGEDRNGGHYFTCVLQDDKWVEYNDSTVTVHKDSAKIEQMIEENCYIFLYSLSKNP